MNIALIRTMDSQGRIVIPAEIRKQMKLSDGDALEQRRSASGSLSSLKIGKKAQTG